MIPVTFTCLECKKEFDCLWTFDDDVSCPECYTAFDTDYDLDIYEELTGPWLVRVNKNANRLDSQ